MDINNLCNFFFVGIVTDVNPAEGTVIVTRPDKNDRTTAALKVIQRGTCKTKDYWMPAVNDQVLCLVLPNVSVDILPMAKARGFWDNNEPCLP